MPRPKEIFDAGPISTNMTNRSSGLMPRVSTKRLLISACSAFFLRRRVGEKGDLHRDDVLGVDA